MGRRAADLTAPVPVLGVPALVGVRGWRTSAGDRTGGALLQSWGPQCSIGVQTSPGVGRPPPNFSMQLTGALSPLSDSIQMSNSFISNDSEYKEILKSHKEKGAILKLKTRSSKTKKEVTFKTVACEASKDVTCSLEICQTYCHAREIRRSLHLSEGAGTKSKMKPTRYSNGSVVDSEAIGGISVDDMEAEPAGKKQSKLQSYCAEKSGKVARPFQDAGKKICVQCGRRQLDAPGGIPSDQKSACLGEKGVAPLLTPSCFPTTELERKLQQSQCQLSEEGIPVSPRLFVSEEFMHRKVGPPPCPLHSRSISAGASKASLTQPSAFVSAKTVKATIETKPPHYDKIPQATRLQLTPWMATATKSNVPHPHTYPQNRAVPQRDLASPRSVPLSVCVSVHAAPDSTPPPLYTTATGAGTAPVTNRRKRGEFSAVLAPAENTAVAGAKGESQSSAFAAKLIADGRQSKCTQMTIKCHTVSLAPSGIEAAHKLETYTQTAPGGQSSIPPNSGHKPQQRLLLNSVMDSSRLPAISSTPCSDARQSTLKRNSDKITHYPAKPATLQRHPVQPEHTSTESPPRVCSATPNAALNSSTHQNSGSRPLSAAAPNPTSACANAKAIALRDSSTCPKTSPPTAAASSSALAGNPTNVGPISLPSADEMVGITQTDQGNASKAQTSDEPGSGCAASAEGNGSAARPAEATPPKHQRRDTDASHNKSHITPRNDVQSASKVNGNPIKKLVTYESGNLENSSVSQVTSLQNDVSLIKPGNSCLHACMSTERCCEGYTERVCPPVNTDQQAKKEEKDKHTPSASSLVNPSGVSKSVIRLTSGPEPPSLPPAHKGPELSSTPTPPLHNPGGLRSGPLASHPRPQSIVREDSKSSPGDTGSAHSHPADVTQLLPPSPQCCGSANLQQKLESVEASLAANKDRITTLLNIIHDLEMSHPPGSGRRCDAAGQDLRNCATCQKTACVVYSVEYDFRQQERRLMEVLNHPARGSEALPTRLARSLNVSALRNTIKNLARSKGKSKKLCKTLFKWLPGKIQQR